MNTYLFSEPVNMSLSFDGLQTLIKKHLRKSPHSGDQFLFFNKKCNYLKVLRHDGTGFLLLAKRLDSGEFGPMSRIKNRISSEELDFILNGASLISKEAA